MQGLITIDFGNSHPNCGLFTKEGPSWKLKQIVLWAELKEALSRLSMTPLNSSMVLSEVKPDEKELLPYLEEGFLLTRIKDYWRGDRFAGMPVHYAQTLGEDRLILAHYFFKTNRRPTLIIDAGTFVTMDVINADGFQGGYIIPGMDLYFDTYSNGSQLKELKLIPEISQGLPHTSIGAMSASYTAFGNLARELVNQYQLEKIFITGGNRKYWEELLMGLDIQVIDSAIHDAIHHWFTTQIELL